MCTLCSLRKEHLLTILVTSTDPSVKPQPAKCGATSFFPWTVQQGNGPPPEHEPLLLGIIHYKITVVVIPAIGSGVDEMTCGSFGP